MTNGRWPRWRDRIMRKHRKAGELVDGLPCVYSFRSDVAKVRAMQQASLSDRTDAGLSQEPHLIGSAKFWAAVRAGRLPRSTYRGNVESVVWTGMGDYPEFVLRTADGTQRSFSRLGDVGAYYPGLRVAVETTELPWKPTVDALTPNCEVILRVGLEAGRYRSSTTAPGPWAIQLSDEPHPSQLACALVAIEGLPAELLENQLAELVDYHWAWFDVVPETFSEWHDAEPKVSIKTFAHEISGNVQLLLDGLEAMLCGQLFAATAMDEVNAGLGAVLLACGYLGAPVPEVTGFRWPPDIEKPERVDLSCRPPNALLEKWRRSA